MGKKHSDIGEWAYKLQRQCEEACYLAGIKTIPDDKCCQLLAWAYVYGGGHEATVMNVAFSEAILAAQRKHNILGGEVPDQKLAPIMLNYIKSVTDFNNPPEWVTELEKEYGIRAYRSKK